MNIKKCVRGSSLLEVLIALFVLAVGMLGVLAMQSNAVKTARVGVSHSVAESLLVDIYEVMRTTPESHRDKFKIDFDETPDARPSCLNSGAVCSGDDVVLWQLNNWRESVQQSLPAGQSAISQLAPGSPDYTIEIQFSGGYEEDSATGGVKEAGLETVKLEVSFGNI